MTPFFGWVLLGLFLIIAEFIVPGFIIFFFGLSAIVTGILKYFFPGMELALCLTIFALLGTALLFLCRRFFPKIIVGGDTADATPRDVDSDEVAGEHAMVTEEISPSRNGKVEFRGSYWSATADAPIAAGKDVMVVARKNLVLVVKEM